MRAGLLNQDALDLIEADFIAAPVVELGGAGRGVDGDHGGFFQHATRA